MSRSCEWPNVRHAGEVRSCQQEAKKSVSDLAGGKRHYCQEHFIRVQHNREWGGKRDPASTERA